MQTTNIKQRNPKPNDHPHLESIPNKNQHRNNQTTNENHTRAPNTKNFTTQRLPSPTSISGRPISVAWRAFSCPRDSTRPWRTSLHHGAPARADRLQQTNCEALRVRQSTLIRPGVPLRTRDNGRRAFINSLLFRYGWRWRLMDESLCYFFVFQQWKVLMWCSIWKTLALLRGMSVFRHIFLFRFESYIKITIQFQIFYSIYQKIATVYAKNVGIK